MGQIDSETDYQKQERLVSALLKGAALGGSANAIHVIETHISWVLLTQKYVYKIKKSVDMGFLDFSTLERRRFFCHEEVRLNARTAPEIYLDVIAFYGSHDTPVMDGENAIEYAVRMHRFSTDDAMDRLIVSGKLSGKAVSSLAKVLAEFHNSLPPIPSELPYGKAADLHKVLKDNFNELPAGFLDTIGKFSLAAMEDVTEDEFLVREGLISNRRALGFVRECHGDLHLGNVVLIEGQAVPFDGIEFNPALRWIDIMADTAFPFMDFLYHDRLDLAYRFLNAWLEKTGDYAGLALLPIYASYRAAVRAKVHAIRASQPDVDERNQKFAQDAFYKYQMLACTSLAQPRAFLMITHGLPGSGKTTFSQSALERLGAIRIRSDVERKRLFGLASNANSQESLGKNIYTSEITDKTYERLHEMARSLLRLGRRVIVDAAFLKRGERRQFQRLALQMGIPFIVAFIHAEDEILRERIAQRLQEGKDASEADLNVLDTLKTSRESMDEDELPHVITFHNTGADGFSQDHPGWGLVDKALNA